MPNLNILSGVAAMIALAVTSQANADDLASRETENSLWTRPALLDGPESQRQELREHGVDLKASWTQFGQSLVKGDGDHAVEWGGKGDIVISANGQKLGLWPGFFVNFHQEFLAGNDALTQGDGVLIPINTAMAFPRLGGKEADTSLIFTQILDANTTLSAGKFNMLDAAANTPLLGGGGLHTFMNTAFAAPISGVTPPYLIGASLGFKHDPLSFNVFIYDPRNAQDSDVVTDPFADGVTLSVSSTFATKVYDLPGFYTVRGVLSTDESVDLADVPQLILPPDVASPVGTARDPWYISFSVQQYLWINPDDPTKGWGVFGQIGFSDENPTLVGTSYFLGIAGTAPFDKHPNDRWGIGYFRTQLSNTLVSSLSAPPIRITLGPEKGIEAYYNHEVAPWLHLTADIQLLNGLPAPSDDSVYFGLRTKIDF